MIRRLRHMIGSVQVGESHPEFGYVRAVPHPFYGGIFDRCRDAAAVLRGTAFAVRWPKGGELEMALYESITELYVQPQPTGERPTGSTSAPHPVGTNR